MIPLRTEYKLNDVYFLRKVDIGTIAQRGNSHFVVQSVNSYVLCARQFRKCSCAKWESGQSENQCWNTWALLDLGIILFQIWSKFFVVAFLFVLLFLLLFFVVVFIFFFYFFLFVCFIHYNIIAVLQKTIRMEQGTFSRNPYLDCFTQIIDRYLHFPTTH